MASGQIRMTPDTMRGKQIYGNKGSNSKNIKVSGKRGKSVA